MKIFGINEVYYSILFSIIPERVDSITLSTVGLTNENSRYTVYFNYSNSANYYSITNVKIT